MNDIIDDMYLKYIECLETKSKNICDFVYLNSSTPLKIKNDKEKQAFKDTWRFVNRGNFIQRERYR